MEQKFSSKELDRAKIIAAVVDKKLGVAEAAKFVRITPRQVNRLVKMYKEHGNKGLINKAKGKTSCNKIPDRVRKRIIWLATNEFDNFGPTFLSEVLAELDAPIKVSVTCHHRRPNSHLIYLYFKELNYTV